MKECMFLLDAEAKEPMYQQLYSQIKEGIEKGEILVGEKLPSTRLLADLLKVSRSTIDMAYIQLLAEGYVNSVPCKGYFVEKNEVLLHREIRTQEKKQSASMDKEEVRSTQEEKSSFVCDFSPNGVDKQSFPLATWKSMYREVLKEQGNELFSKGNAKGEETLRESIATYLYHARGVQCEAGQIIIGAGNDYLLMLLALIFQKLNYTIGITNVTYKKAFQIFSVYNLSVVPMDMDDSGVAMKGLKEKNPDVLYTMPSHHFPTGIVMPIGRRRELLNWANEAKNRYIIEDDYDSEFRYSGRPIPALAASDQEDRVIYMGTFSKSLAPAIRISYMLLPKSLAPFYENTVGTMSSTVSRLDQITLHQFMKEGYFERHIHRMRKLYKGKRDFLLEQLKGLENSFSISGEDAGLHILIRDKKNRNEREMIRKALKNGVKVYGISDFQIGNPVEMQTTFLIGYAECTYEEIEKGVQILKQIWG